MHFNCASREHVVIGTCVMLEDDQIVYAGPIKGAPIPEGCHLVLLNPTDFEKLKTLVEKRRH